MAQSAASVQIMSIPTANLLRYKFIMSLLFLTFLMGSIIVFSLFSIVIIIIVLVHMDVVVPENVVLIE